MDFDTRDYEVCQQTRIELTPNPELCHLGYPEL